MLAAPAESFLMNSAASPSRRCFTNWGVAMRAVPAPQGGVRRSPARDVTKTMAGSVCSAVSALCARIRRLSSCALIASSRAASSRRTCSNASRRWSPSSLCANSASWRITRTASPTSTAAGTRMAARNSKSWRLCLPKPMDSGAILVGSNHPSCHEIVRLREHSRSGRSSV